MKYQRVSPKNALELAAPHTWPASVFPVLLGTLLSIAASRRFDPIVFLPLLAAAVLLQSSVNTINDYFDFLKGTDLRENSDDPSDAVLIYNNVNPKHVLRLGAAYMAAAALFGLYPIYRGGPYTLLLGAVGCVVIVAYSAGKRPISHLPLGELVSGVVMGALLTAAAFSAFTGRIDREVWFFASPLVVGIGLIMMTNNSCDIERDARSGRRTLPSLLGRTRARRLYRLLAVIWVLLIAASMLVGFPKGALTVCICLAMSGPPMLRLLRSPLIPELRGQCMGAVMSAMIWLSCSYLAGIAAHIILTR
jgi:1,4-dihydroxy-2-naphthoate octaprenyltransferase